MTIDPRIEKEIRSEFGIEAEIIIFFLKLGIFNLSAQTAIKKMFLISKQNGVSVDAVFEECIKAWQISWIYQRPEIWADISAGGAVGDWNRKSLKKIYEVFNLPLPKEFADRLSNESLIQGTSPPIVKAKSS